MGIVYSVTLKEKHMIFIAWKMMRLSLDQLKIEGSMISKSII